MQRLKDEFIEKLERTIPLAEKVVLEIGCGTGERTAQIAKRCRTVIGVDPCTFKIGEALQRGIRNAAFIRATAQQTGLGEGEVDVVVFALSLHHVSPPEMPRAIDEAVRVTKQGGRIVFLEPGTDGSFFEAEILFGACDGDERAAKVAAQRAMREHPRLELLAEFGDETVFRFKSDEDFIASMTPKKNLKLLGAFLLRCDYTLTAERCVSVYKPRL